MAMGKLLSVALLSVVTELALQTPAAAWQVAPNTSASASGATLREHDTERALLTSLIARRSEIAQSAVDPAKIKERRYALNFLDRLIDQMRKRLGE